MSRKKRINELAGVGAVVTEIQVYYSAREIQVSESETAMQLIAELGEATPGSGEAQALIDAVINSGRGLECVVAESDLARDLELGDLVDVDSDGVIRRTVAA